ncbi:MAG: transglutaminase family protein [Spirochaetes bacterium]|jgi:transglutaminase-like putative cysteine protease|nr:transglutaminase family protein [Spirochaetota bacterium]
MSENNKMFLNETYYCDFNNPVFENLPINLSKSISSTAVEIFNFVRDSLPLCADAIKVKASETMRKKYGACWNKALLLAAISRKYSIPGRIVKRPLNKNFLKPLLGNDVFFINNPYYHYFVQMLIDGQWTYADPSLDSKSFDALYRPLNVAWGIKWDGKSDHIIHNENILGPIEVIDDIDQAFNSGLGNRSTPGYLINILNKKYWKKTGWDKVLIK